MLSRQSCRTSAMLADDMHVLLLARCLASGQCRSACTCCRGGRGRGALCILQPYCVKVGVHFGGWERGVGVGSVNLQACHQGFSGAQAVAPLCVLPNRFCPPRVQGVEQSRMSAHMPCNDSNQADVACKVSTCKAHSACVICAIKNVDDRLPVGIKPLPDVFIK